VIFVKCSGRFLATVVVIGMSGSIGFGAILDADCEIKPSDGQEAFLTGVVDVGEPFIGTDLDLHSLNREVVERGNIAIAITDSPVNTIGDVPGVFRAAVMTNVQINFNEVRTDRYQPFATIHGSNIREPRTVDLTGSEPIVLDPAKINYAVGTRLEIAVKATKFGNLAPASPFDFKVDLLAIRTNRDDQL